MASKSLCSGNECLSPALGGHKVVCQSSIIQSGAQDSYTSSTPNGSSSACWKAQGWFLALLNKFIDLPSLIHKKPISKSSPSISIGYISSISSKARTFHKKLSHFSLSPVGPKQTSCTIHCLVDGVAWVLNRISSQFQ